MGYRYIGAKKKISDRILEEVSRVTPPKGTVVDLMCGTGAISVELRKRGYRVIACDVMLQACLLTKAKLLLQIPPRFDRVKKYLSESKQQFLGDESGYLQMIYTLNNLEGIK